MGSSAADDPEPPAAQSAVFQLSGIHEMHSEGSPGDKAPSQIRLGSLARCVRDHAAGQPAGQLCAAKQAHGEASVAFN